MRGGRWHHLARQLTSPASHHPWRIQITHLGAHFEAGRPAIAIEASIREAALPEGSSVGPVWAAPTTVPNGSRSKTTGDKSNRMDNRIANTTKGPIEYTLLGNGPVILVCHGTSSNCFSADGYAPFLKAGFSVLTPSRPGYGRTPLAVGVSAKEAANAMIALLDMLEISTCVSIAISGGGPTGISLAANWPHRIHRLSLIAAIARPEDRSNEPAYRRQVDFYGPMHNVIWKMLHLMSWLSPDRIARQTMAIFSNHDPEDAFRRLTRAEIKNICSFYQRRSSRQGALNDFAQTVGKELLQKIEVPTLVIHSREDGSVPFSHAEWSLAHIPHAELCESGFTGHFYWVGPDYQRVSQRLVDFFKAEAQPI